MARGKHERTSKPIGTKKKMKKPLSKKKIVLGAIAAIVLAFVIWVLIGVDFGFISSVDKLNLNLMSVVYGRDDKGEFTEFEYISSGEKRVWASIDEISEDYKDAFVAIEDERFYKHKGIDLKRTTGAVLNEIFGESTYGGSTITQQLVKNITGDKERSYVRKFREIIRALVLETKLSKDEILEMYMNSIYLGEGCYGVEAASNFYFGKSADELSLAQCASIAGITQYPSKFDPLLDPEANKDKQMLVLSKMLEHEYITQEEYNEAAAEELDFSNAGKTKVLSNQSYFVDQVIEDVIKDLQSEKGYSETVASQLVYGGGLKIYATVNPKVQNAMEEVFENEANYPNTSGDVKPEAAMVVSDVTTGEVVGIIGGRGEKTQDRVLNRATHTNRQPGSSIKPVAVYAPALDTGIITNASIIEDKETTYGNWTPKNYYNDFYGNMTVRRAVELSSNIPAVKVLDDLGVSRSYDYMKNRLNFSTIVDGVKKGNKVYTDKNLSSLALGGLTNGVKVIELNAAYNAIANSGIYMEPITYLKVLDANDKVILEKGQKVNSVFREDTAYLTTQLLKSVVDYGTGVGAKISGMDTCGKTGTTDDDNDRWFAGYTPYYTGTVWFGYDTPKTIVVYGANPALTLWKKVMTKVHSGLASKTFTRPSNVQSAYICTESGELAGEECKSVLEFFAKGKTPAVYCDGTKHKVDEEEENPEGEEGLENENTEDGPISIPPSEHTPGGNTKPDSGESESIDLDSIL